jgi:hypothetical protein
MADRDAERFKALRAGAVENLQARMGAQSCER